ncbi:MAG: DUF805 domain-containing protein [Thalassobium sp.]|uniref:DUF805 domain-containing protein n=1 Tax=Octadecabacter sp. SW4 TaxID=2602067 RepID=UPI000C0F4464|nr:DUF805 domain-containing protein [Octadecabacter sp. SW4]PHQ84252.1 MAG: DUF805 domain-containing protein [Thalassobium sp.]QEE36788.1 DUF805 domain-containing protein [Octadecabacter sp. SW4]|tara:strand:+ start:197 stop:556 length:360 start_codon:yes stop_codon:yes gene_type:complete
MGFGDAIRTCLNKYFTIQGRASRSEYWWFYLFVFLVGTVPTQLGAAMQSNLITIIGGLISLALLVPIITAGIRRLHDKDKSGWWFLIGLVPIVGIILLLVWFVTEGTKGPNRFGEDPLA